MPLIMFVSISTRAATPVKPLPGPASFVGAPRGAFCFAASLSVGRRIEEAQPRFNVESPGLPASIGRHNADDLARSLEANVVPRPYPVTVRERLGHRDLKFARDLAHILTLARAISLSRRIVGTLECGFVRAVRRRTAQGRYPEWRGQATLRDSYQGQKSCASFRFSKGNCTRPGIQSGVGPWSSYQGRLVSRSRGRWRIATITSRVIPRQ